MNPENKKDYSKNIFKINVLYVLAGFTMFFIPIIIFYYQHYNLTYFQISITISLGLLATLLLEVPTGAFADLYGKKISMSIGLFLFSVGVIIIAFTTTLFYFIVAGVIWGIGQAFLSGAWDALMYDSLKATNKEKDYLKISGRQQSLFLVVLIISGFAAPYLFTINVKYPFYISIFFSLFLFIFSLSLFEILPKKRKFSLNEHIDQMKSGFDYVKKHSAIIWLIAFGLLSLSVNGIYGQLISSPYNLVKGFKIEQIGIVSFFMIIFQIIAMNLGHKFEKKLKEKKALIYTFAGWILFCILTYFSHKFIFVLISGIFGGFISIQLLLINSFLVHRLRKKIRATVISIFSMIASLIGVVLITVSGIIIDRTSLQFMVMTISLTSLIIGTILLIIRYNKKIWKKIS